MLELIFQGFMEWAYGLVLECWEYFSSSLLDIMSMDYAYMKSHVPVMVSIAQVLLAVGWALLIGNLVFQALKSMAVGLGFEGEDPKLLFTRTFVFAFLLMASPQICEVGLSLTARIIELLEIPDAINVTLVDEGVFGSLGAAWLLVIIFGLIIMLKVSAYYAGVTDCHRIEADKERRNCSCAAYGARTVSAFAGIKEEVLPVCSSAFETLMCCVCSAGAKTSGPKI